MLEEIIGGIIEAIGFDMADSAVRRRQERKARREGKVRGALRSTAGTVAWVDSRWRVSVVEPGRGRITGDSWSLDILAARRRSEPLKLMQQHPLGVDAVVLELTVHTGTVEWALPKADAASAMERLGFVLV